MRSFGPDAAGPAAPSHIDFATAVGVAPEAVTVGLEAIETLIRSESLSVSRLSGLAVPGDVPAVRGLTVSGADVLAVPNAVGRLEPTKGRAVIVEPYLAGRVELSGSVEMVGVVVGGAGAVVTGPISVPDDVAESAQQARTSAQLLAKRCNQLPGVRTAWPVESGRWVLTTPSRPEQVLDRMRAAGVIGAVPYRLGDIPGGIVVTVGGGHDEGDLDAFVDALAGALARGRSIESEEAR